MWNKQHITISNLDALETFDSRTELSRTRLFSPHATCLLFRQINLLFGGWKSLCIDYLSLECLLCKTKTDNGLGSYLLAFIVFDTNTPFWLFQNLGGFNICMYCIRSSPGFQNPICFVRGLWRHEFLATSVLPWILISHVLCLRNHCPDSLAS